MEDPLTNFQPAPPPTMSAMSTTQKRNRAPLLAGVFGGLFILTLAAFIWAFTQYLDHKNNVDGKVAAAVTEAEKNKAAELEAGFQAERDRLFNKYTTDPGLANVTLEYPRDWSFYLEQEASSREQINAIFHPTVVASGNPGTYGMRMQLVQRLYSEVTDDYRKGVEDGTILASPVRNGSVEGLRYEGQIDRDHNGAVVVFPVRDKTLLIFTDSKEYIGVFNEAVAKLVFTP